MENEWKREITVLTSMCDAQGRMSVREIFDICMDLAAEHAAQLGVSYYDMLERRCFWVAVRTRVRLYDPPILGDRITAETWPGKPSLAKSDRFYRLLRDGIVMAEGRTEWAVQDIDTGAVRRTDSYGYPMELTPREERVCAESFTRFRQLSPEPQQLAQVYTVGSQDIDLGRHMNNVAYIRMLMGTFSNAELDKMHITEVEISYRRACFEGEALQVYRRFEDGVWFFQVQKPDGEIAVQALLCTA